MVLDVTNKKSLGMSSLVSLNASKSSSCDLATISKDLPKLRSIWVDCSSKSQLSRDIRIILDSLSATTNFGELESTSTTSQVPNMKNSALIECCSQVHISRSTGSLKSLLIHMGMNCQGSYILKQSILQNMTTSDGGLLPGDSYPHWLSFNSNGSSVIFYVPEVNGRNLTTMMCVIHFFTPDNITSDGLQNMLVINHTKPPIQLYKRDTLVSFEDEEWLRVVSNIEPGNKVEVVVVFENGFIVKKTTIYLIYDEPIDKKLEYSHADKTVIDSSGNESLSAVMWISPQEESISDFKQKQKRRKFE